MSELFDKPNAPELVKIAGTGDGAEQLDDASPPSTGNLPENIGPYSFVRELGRGAMGVVYEVEHALLQKRFALKVLSPDRIPDKKTTARFRQEARALSELDQTSLLRIFEFGISDKGQPFIVTDLFEGQSLDAMLSDADHQPLPTAITTEIALQSATALASAHAKGVVHRDIKPSNILVKQLPDEAVQLKVIDFGIAKCEESINASSSGLTSTGELLGTPRYMSPEQCHGDKPDRRSDIYSLGCVLYEMLAGKPPFQSDRIVQVMVGHMTEPPPPISTTDPVRRSLEAVALKCLEKEPDKRYQSMDALIKDLESASRGTAIRAQRIKPKKKSSSTFASRLKFYIPLSVAAILLAVAAGYQEVWAPGVVLYTDLPMPVKQVIMDQEQAKCLMAIREANRLRVEANVGGVVDMSKIKLAENMLRPYASNEKPWNATANNLLAEVLAIEGRLPEVESMCRKVSGDNDAGTAQALHSVGVSINHRGFHQAALPVMERSLELFVKSIGPDNAYAVKEQFNIAAAKLDLHRYGEALADFKAVRPRLKQFLPSAVPQADLAIRQLEN